MASSSCVDINSNIIPAFPQRHNAIAEYIYIYILKAYGSIRQDYIVEMEGGHNLSSKVVLAAELTIMSTSLAILSAKSSSNPRLDSQTFPTTGTSLFNMKDW